jgi:glycosyltransferase involved in cell wall biosynthesis
MTEQIEYWLDRRHFDVVQVEYTHMAHYLPPPCPGLRRVLVEHDVTFVALARARRVAGSLARRASLWLDGLRTLRHEVAAVESADLVLTMSEDDREALARFVDPRHIEVAPNGVSCRDFPERRDEPEPATVLFVGFFRHEPNVEAVMFFAQQVLPGLRERVPGVRMVPETASHYRRATVFVAPILRGSGTRLKILEAMSSGCPVVSTTIGAEGLGATDAEIRIADTPEDFAAAIADLVSDASLRRMIARRARAFVERRYDWPAIAARLVAVYGLDVGRRGDDAEERPGAEDMADAAPVAARSAG